MLTRKILLMVAISLNFSIVRANDTWSNPGLIQSVQVMNQGGFLIQFEESAKDFCNQEGLPTILFFPNRNGVSFEGAKSLLSTALIAFTSSQNVNVMYNYSMSSGYCFGHAIRLARR